MQLPSCHCSQVPYSIMKLVEVVPLLWHHPTRVNENENSEHHLTLLNTCCNIMTIGVLNVSIVMIVPLFLGCKCKLMTHHLWSPKFGHYLWNSARPVRLFSFCSVVSSFDTNFLDIPQGQMECTEPVLISIFFTSYWIMTWLFCIIRVCTNN